LTVTNKMRKGYINMESDHHLSKFLISVQKHISLQQCWYSHAAKRLMDILAALLGLVLLSPFFLIVGWLIKRDSPGPVFFRGPRMGKGGRIFYILKFRTMREESASRAGPSVTAQDDPRITPFGRWLRDTKLNELPQLWNVLVGEMSLVGPRPEDPEIAKTWPEAARREILSVRPGITSPTSVAYHDEENRLKAASVMDDYMETILPDKLRLDQLYVRHHTFITDLDALFWTFVILIPRLGDQKIAEGWLFGGPVSRFVRRYVNWMAIDFLTAFASIGLVGVIWRLAGPLELGLWRALNLAVFLAFLFGFFNSLLGLKSVSWSRAAAEDAVYLFISCGLVTLIMVLLQSLIVPQYRLPLPFISTVGLMVSLSFIAVRYRLRLVTGLASRWIHLRNSGYGAGERVLVVGAGQGSVFAAWLLRHKDFRRLYTVVGIADDDPYKQGMRFDGLPVLGTTADIPELVRRHDIGVIFYAIMKISADDHERILTTCKKTQLRVIMLSELLRGVRSYLLMGRTDSYERTSRENIHS
jgi:lipopolysaccharide/colanic/teichoic acid biosynthesis glycosyltransferase